MRNPIKRIISVVKNPIKLFYYGESKGLFDFLSDKLYIKLFYYLNTGSKLNLNNPESFNEKLQWLKMNNKVPLYSLLADKYAVRKFIENKLGSENLIPLLGVYNNFDEINFDKLPKQFVLKCTHDSGGIVICKDKSKLDLKHAKKLMNKSLKTNYFYRGREWIYKDIKPRIVCEKLLVDESNTELKDYKFFCFNGEPKLIQVDFNRFTNHQRNIYDIEWNMLDLSIKYPNNKNLAIKKPNKLDEMLKFASELSRGMPHVRVDFYYIEGEIYFGEMTFFHGSGYEKFTPEKYNEILGNWIELPGK